MALRKHNGNTCYSHEIIPQLKSGVPQGTFTDNATQQIPSFLLVVFITWRQLNWSLNNVAGLAATWTTLSPLPPKFSPSACKSNYANDTQVRNEHYTDYIACQSDLKVMYGYWCRPGFKSEHQLFYLPLQSMNWIILSERSNNHLLHAYQRLLFSGIQTLSKKQSMIQKI